MSIDDMKIIDPYLNEDGKIKNWPSKQLKKKLILNYLLEKFDKNYIYNEKEVNKIIGEWSLIGDILLLRRGLVDNLFLTRTTDGREYRYNNNL